MATDVSRTEARRAGRPKHPMVERRDEMMRLRTRVPDAYTRDAGGSLIPVGADTVFEYAGANGDGTTY